MCGFLPATTFYLDVKAAWPKAQRILPLPLRQAILLTSTGNRIEFDGQTSLRLDGYKSWTERRDAIGE